jgi:DNA-binding CsgD family transcriptional regulator
MLSDEDPLRIKAEELRAGAAMYDPRLISGFVDGLPTLEQLVASRRPATRPLALLLASWGAQRDGSPDQIRALVEFGWDEGRYIDDGETVEILPQGFVALALIDEFDRAAAMVDRFRAAARKRGSAVQYLLASAHDAWLDCLRGNLDAAAAEMRNCVERAIELNLPFAVMSLLWYCAEVLVERPDAADLAAMAEAIELGPLADTLSGATLIATRGRLRFVAGDTPAAIADLRHVGAVHDALGVTNSMGFSSWRLALALMLDRSQRDEALMLTQTEVTAARRGGQAWRLGAALRTLGTLEPDSAAGEAHLAEAVALLAGTPMRLEYARALVELGAARRRNGERASARGPIRDGLDLATHCGAVRLADRARSELAATGARPRNPYATGPDALTASELRVAQMAAEGRTSQEIAQALFVTTKTIDGHLNHTYNKLGINSRKQLAAELAKTKDR